MEIIVCSDGSPAVLSSQVEWTLAVEVIGQVNTLSNGWTGIVGAVVDVDLTVLAFISIRTHTLVSLAIVNTSGSILASSLSTSIILILTPNTREVSGAGAVEVITKIFAGSTIHAGVSNTSLR